MNTKTMIITAALTAASITAVHARSAGTREPQQAARDVLIRDGYLAVPGTPNQFVFAPGYATVPGHVILNQVNLTNRQIVDWIENSDVPSDCNMYYLPDTFAPVQACLWLKTHNSENNPAAVEMAAYDLEHARDQDLQTFRRRARAVLDRLDKGSQAHPAPELAENSVPAVRCDSSYALQKVLDRVGRTPVPTDDDMLRLQVRLHAYGIGVRVHDRSFWISPTVDDVTPFVTNVRDLGSDSSDSNCSADLHQYYGGLDVTSDAHSPWGTRITYQIHAQYEPNDVTVEVHPGRID